MKYIFQSPLFDVLCAIGLIVVGALMFAYRNDLGALTGYYAGKGGYVNKPTPGWMLIPFALALMIGGVLVIARLL